MGNFCFHRVLRLQFKHCTTVSLDLCMGPVKLQTRHSTFNILRFANYAVFFFNIIFVYYFHRDFLAVMLALFFVVFIFNFIF